MLDILPDHKNWFIAQSLKFIDPNDLKFKLNIHILTHQILTDF